MPSDDRSNVPDTPDPSPITGRCYCGATRLSAPSRPQTVSYCHCSDCRRITGAPVAAFAAFARDDVTITPEPAQVSCTNGVERRFCGTCGSPLAAWFDYLPGQVYVPVGILDQADDLAPDLHSHAESRLRWLHIQDDLDQNPGSARDVLAAAQRGSGSAQ